MWCYKYNIYVTYYLQIVLLGLHAHLNSIFAHIIEYNFFYHTLEDKEIEVLQVRKDNISFFI